MPALTNRERRALTAVALIVVLSAAVQWMRPHKSATKAFDYTLQDSLFKALSVDTFKTDPETEPLKKSTQTSKVRKAKKRKSVKEILAPKSINPNTASAAELERLPRIGPKTAQAIVRYRLEHGPFKSIEELDKVKRIGPKTIERIRPFLILPQAKSEADSISKTKEP